MVKKRFDGWLIVSVLLLVLFIAVLIYPMFGVIKQAVIMPDGSFSWEQFHKFFSNSYYVDTIYNSFKITIFRHGAHARDWHPVCVLLCVLPPQGREDSLRRQHTLLHVSPVFGRILVGHAARTQRCHHKVFQSCPRHHPAQHLRLRRHRPVADAQVLPARVHLHERRFQKH